MRRGLIEKEKEWVKHKRNEKQIDYSEWCIYLINPTQGEISGKDS